MLKVDNVEPWFDWTETPPTIDQIMDLNHLQVLDEVRPDTGVVDSIRVHEQGHHNGQEHLDQLLAVYQKLARQELLTQSELLTIGQHSRIIKPRYPEHIRFVPGPLRLNGDNFRRLHQWWIHGNLEILGVHAPYLPLVLNGVHVGWSCIISGNTLRNADIKDVTIQGKCIVNRNSFMNEAFYDNMTVEGAMQLQSDLVPRPRHRR